jgi:hypothetical protein
VGDLDDDLRALERRRLRCLVGRRTDEARELHTADFRIVTPSGWGWNRDEYLGGIADGSIDYRRFEPVSEIEVAAGAGVAVVRYRSAIEIAVAGQEPGTLECWHLDCYVQEDGAWRVRWSQATEIRRRP